jgi:hypothetical protein
MGDRDRSSHSDHEARISYAVDHNDDLGEKIVEMFAPETGSISRR